MLFLLVLLLLILLLVNYSVNDRVLFAPSVIFTASFLASCAFAAIYKSQWSLNLHLNTFLVIFLGVAEFSFIAFMISSLYSNLVPLRFNENPNELNTDRIDYWKIVLTIVIELVTILWTIHSVHNVDPSASLSGAIFEYRSRVINPILMYSLPAFSKYLLLLRSFADALGYFFAFLLVKNYMLVKKIDVLYVVIVILSIISGLLLGSRTGAFTLLLCVLVYVFCFYEQKYNWKAKFNLKMISIAALILFVILLVFQSLAGLLGRTVDEMSTMDYLAMYIGAEIKNLDTFLQRGLFPIKSGLWGGQTFYYLNRTVANFLGIKNFKIAFDLPFQYINGHSLGNVYTTFYAFIYDFGYAGVVFLIGLMSAVSQVVFEHVKRFRVKCGASVFILIYGQIVAALLLSFFSNKFYEGIFNTTFIKVIIFWIMFNWFYGPGLRKSVSGG